MAYIRMHEKGTYHFVTNRTEHELFFMLPNATIVAIITEWFTKAMALYGGGIELFAVIFLSNHYHLLLRDNGGNLGRFMCYMQCNIAKAINKLLDRKGKFWARHYDDMIVDGDNSFLNRYAYSCCNTVKAGLTDRAEEWLGFNGLKNAKTGEPIKVTVLNKTKYFNAKRNRKKAPNKKKFMETFEFKMAVPPMWQGQSQSQIAANIDELVKVKERELHKKREFKPALGMETVMAQKPTDSPKNPSNSPRVRFMADTKERVKELHEKYRYFNGIYLEIWGQFTKATGLGRRPTVEWPPWSYPPSMWIPMGYDKAA